jgi:hypothetical protein
MPSTAARCAHAPVIQRLSDSSKRGRPRRLYLTHDGQHVGGKGVRCLTVGSHALGLRIGKVGSVSQNGPLAQADLPSKRRCRLPPRMPLGVGPEDEGPGLDRGGCSPRPRSDHRWPFNPMRVSAALEATHRSAPISVPQRALFAQHQPGAAPRASRLRRQYRRKPSQAYGREPPKRCLSGGSHRARQDARRR